MATFVRVVDAGSLSRAARTLRLSLPAVSRQLRALEAELGTTLLVRSTRRMHMTDEGRRFYAESASVLRAVDSARSAARPLVGVGGRIVLSTPISLGLAYVVPRIAKLQLAEPALAVEIRMEDRVVDIVSDGVDIALRAGILPPDSTRFVAHRIAEFPRWLVASNSYLRKAGAVRDVAQLARHACLVQVGPSGAQRRWRLVGEGDDNQVVEVAVSGPTECNAPAVLRDLALAGLGIAFVADWLVREDVEQARLRRVLPEWRGERVRTWAVHRAELRGSPNVRAVIGALHS